jgi:hypothetical protein
MMDDAMATQIKGELDAALENVGPTVGIAFEIDVFDEFVRRKWITLGEMKILGLFGVPEKLPVYGSHLAIRAWDIPPPGFKVGKDA